MTDETLAEILSGEQQQVSPTDLVEDLDTLLADAEANSGRLDPLLFWAFVSQLAKGRGIAEDIGAAAGSMQIGEAPFPGGLIGVWRAGQWALLSALLTRIGLYPGELMPRAFSPSAFRSVAANVLDGKRGGERFDLLGLGTQRGTKGKAAIRAYQSLLFELVHYRAEKTGKSAEEIRSTLMPNLPRRTWQDWTRQVARTKGVPVQDAGANARATARGETGQDDFMLMSDADIADLLKLAWQPNSKL